LLVLRVRDFDVGVLPAFFGENLLPDVVVFVRDMIVAIVAVHLAIENDGGCSRSFGVARHLEVFGRNRLPLIGHGSATAGKR
jgi:hypothetical protein